MARCSVFSPVEPSMRPLAVKNSQKRLSGGFTEARGVYKNPHYATSGGRGRMRDAQPATSGARGRIRRAQPATSGARGRIRRAQPATSGGRGRMRCARPATPGDRGRIRCAQPATSEGRFDIPSYLSIPPGMIEPRRRRDAEPIVQPSLLPSPRLRGCRSLPLPPCGQPSAGVLAPLESAVHFPSTLS